MHQSRMFSIQLKYTFSKCSGTMRMRPERTASIAGSASGLIFTNHWVETIGSMISPPRWERGT